MIIEKSAADYIRFRNNLFYYNRARDAFSEILKLAARNGTKRVLLPGYIGKSAREGSGVFDPIRESGLQYDFYKLDNNFLIEIKDFKRHLTADSLVLIIHYFGYTDEALSDIIHFARDAGAIIVEDCAHAFYSDFFGNKCGHLGDYSIYSLHKQFPFNAGGLLKVNKEKGNLFEFQPVIPNENNPWMYDLRRISETRINNSKVLMEMLSKTDDIKILRPALSCNIVPQTLPILIESDNRDAIYEIMNDAGFGVVSLYHTLIDEIDKGVHQEAYKLSRHIMNLPVHQDVDISQYPQMVDLLVTTICSFCKKGN